MADVLSLPIQIARLDFEIIQGQYLKFPITYTIENVPDTIAGKEPILEIRTTDYTKVLDRLTIQGGRIVVLGPNVFSADWPEAITNKWKLTTEKTKFIYGVKLKDIDGISENILEGFVTARKARVT